MGNNLASERMEESRMKYKETPYKDTKMQGYKDKRIQGYKVTMI